MSANDAIIPFLNKKLSHPVSTFGPYSLIITPLFLTISSYKVELSLGYILLIAHPSTAIVLFLHYIAAC